MRACLAVGMLALITAVITAFILPFCLAAQNVPNQVPPAPVPTQISSAKKVFLSNAGGDELDPRRFDFTTVDPNRIYNHLYASIRAAGKFQLVLAPADADLVLQARFSQSARLSNSTSEEVEIRFSSSPSWTQEQRSTLGVQ